MLVFGFWSVNGNLAEGLPYDLVFTWYNGAFCIKTNRAALNKAYVFCSHGLG